MEIGSVQTLVVDLVVRYGFQVLGAIVILTVGWIVGGWVARVVDGRLQARLDPPMRILLARVTRVLVLGLAGVVALDKLGFEIMPLVAGIGVAGVGIGFAVQGVLGNVVAGLNIILTKPFRVGEHIAVVGVYGDVASIDLTSTTLVHPDRSRVIVPNRKIVGEILHNFGTMRQLALSVTLPPHADVSAALGLARELVAASPRVLKEPAPMIGIEHVGDGVLRLGVRPWVAVADHAVAAAELYQALVERFAAVGLAPALPRQEVRLVDGAAAR
ncbi:MAG TPA: mechanosensitive ion channel family protein [Candidatus Tectomicrobia bacterium]|nr:mechanosensitive ion channel family protein [Candidatus Tectomicrobia bacterium]